MSDSTRSASGKSINHHRTAQQSLTYGNLIDEYHDPKVARTAIQIGALAVIVFLVWAAFAPVHEISVGQGKILPAGFVQNAQHLEGGNVSAILVHEGQSVEQGAPLVELSDTSARAELTKAQARLEFLQLAIQRQDQFSTGVSTQLSSIDEERFADLLKSQQSASDADYDFRTAQLAVIDAELQMKTAEVDSLRIRVEKISEEFTIVTRQLADYDQAVSLGAVSRNERDRIERDKLRLESEKAALEGQLRLAETSVIEANARANELQARMRQAAVGEITDLEVQKAETVELIAQLEDRLSRLVIRAPVDGRINNLGVHNVGEIVGPGQIVAEVVPNSGAVFAEVDVQPDQIGYVHVGLPANVKVLTYDFARYGGIEGKVVDVSPTTIVNDRGEYFYRVRVELTQAYVGDPTDARQITPGMAVVADIRSGEKTVLNYLLKPLRAISDRAFSER